MEENKNVCQNCEVIRIGHAIQFDSNGNCILCGRKVFPRIKTDQTPKLTDISDRANEYGNRLMADAPQMTATLWLTLEKINHEATRAREYLRLTGATCTPDRVHEILHLRTSRATLARKMREAAQRGELLRSYYVNERGTKICQYSFNPLYKESV